MNLVELLVMNFGDQTVHAHFSTHWLCTDKFLGYFTVNFHRMFSPIFTSGHFVYDYFKKNYISFTVQVSYRSLVGHHH